MYTDYFQEVKENATLDDLITVITENNNKALKMQREIESWSKESNYVEPEEISKKDSVVKNTSKMEIDTETKSLYDKISLLDITDLSSEDIIASFKNMLGDNINYSVINKIKLLLYKEALIYQKMLRETSNELEAAELHNVLASVTTKIELLDDIAELEEEVDAEEIITTNNNLFFLLSDTGNVIALESLRKNVPREYYPAFKELLLGLKIGKTKGLKRISRYNCLELKDFKIRVIFDRLSNGNYIILDCFMKKVDTGVSYRNNLDNRIGQYHKKQETFLSKYLEEDFIKEHEAHLAEIINLLDNKTLEGDELNENRNL